MPSYLRIKPSLCTGRHGDFSALRSLCNKHRSLMPYFVLLRKQYRQYLRHCIFPGKAWRFQNGLPEDIRLQLRKAYVSGSALPTFIRSSLLRQNQKMACCPYCGIPTNVTVDHYLPQQHFPQFAALSLNLVPSCSACQNKGAKGDWFPGFENRHTHSLDFDRNPDRILHPYFDHFLGTTVLSLEFTPEKVLREITVRASCRDHRHLRMVDFHIRKLGINVRAAHLVHDLWEDLLERMRGNCDCRTDSGLETFLDGEFQRAYDRLGSPNAIEFVFYRSILRSRAKRNFLRQIAEQSAVGKRSRPLPKGAGWKS